MIDLCMLQIYCHSFNIINRSQSHFLDYFCHLLDLFLIAFVLLPQNPNFVLGLLHLSVVLLVVSLYLLL